MSAPLERLRFLVLRLRVRLAAFICPDPCDPEGCLLLGEHRFRSGACTRCGLGEPLSF